MKITTDLLRKIKACNRAVNMFNNTTELHDIDITTINEITVGDRDLFYDIILSFSLTKYNEYIILTIANNIIE
jgi:hypothetical protein